ncbi:MAG: ABC transporter substrate-binding protein [Methanothrix sp.]
MNEYWKILLCVLTALIASIIACSAASENEENFTLNIFGNANLDNIINEQDVAYVRNVINGTKLATNLSDANYDGKTDEKDIAQIEEIMRGDEKQLTIIDDAGDIITVPQPINRVVLIEGYAALYETWRALGINDKVIGINDRYVEPGGIRYSKKYYPELTTKRNVGSTEEPDLEVIASIAPDVFFIDWSPMYDIKSKLAKAFPHLPAVCMDITYENFTRNTRMTGYIFGKKENAEKYIDWRNGQKDAVEKRTKELPDDKRPSVFMSSYEPGINDFPARGGSRYDPLINGAGGKNICEGLVGLPTSNKVSAEWIIDKNPDIIIFTAAITYSGYEFNADDPSKLAALYKDFMNRSEFAKTNAVKDKRVYFICLPHLLYGGASGIITDAYFAKWMQPNLTTGIDPLEIHKEFLKLQGVNLDLAKYGVFVYPPLEK